MKTHRTIQLKGFRRTLRSESGNTLVETAISLSLLFLLLFGILEGSMAVYSYHYLSHVARQGSRYAMVRGATWGSTCTDYTSAGCTASAAQIQQYVQSLGFPGINENQVTVTVQCATTVGGTFGTYGSSCNSAKNIVQVTVTYPFSVPIAGVNGSCSSTPAKFCMSTSSEMQISN